MWLVKLVEKRILLQHLVRDMLMSCGNDHILKSIAWARPLSAIIRKLNPKI